MKRTCIAAAIIALTGVAGAVTTNNWIYPAVITKGLSVTNAASWSDEANWQDRIVPSAMSDVVQIPNNLAAPYYIKADSAISAAILRDASGSSATYTTASVIPYVICDDGVTLNTSSDGSTVRGIRLYADLSLPNANGAAHLSSFILCGDVSLSAAGIFSINMYNVQHRLDMYANAAGETRTLPTMPQFRNSWGALLVYAPESSPVDVTGEWATTDKSPYIFRTGAKHVISAGTTVTGTGIPDGAYVRRVFADDCIELSVAATNTSPSATLVFAAFTPNVTMPIGTLTRNSTGNSMLRLNKYRAEDTMRCTVGSISDQNYAFPFDTDSGFFPGTFVFKRIVAVKSRISLGDCHMEFAKAESGDSGFLNACVKMEGASKTARLTVLPDVSARICSMTNIIGTLVKDGAGTLVTAFTNAVTKNTGTLVVKEGTFTLVAAEGFTEPSYIKTLAISNGATLKLPPNGLKVDTLVFENGAIVSGEGALVLPGKMDLSGLKFVDGASVSLAGGSGLVMATPPAPAVPGVPALWMDVSKTDSLTIELEDGTNFVTRMNDVRGAEYAYATNVLARPWLEGDKFGHTNLYMKGVSVEGVENVPTLVWDKPIYGIRAVFLVHAPREGGGEILGTSRRIYADVGYTPYYLRAAGASFSHSIVYSGAIGYTRDGRFYINGEPCTYSSGYPYNGICSANGNWHYRPVVVESHPLAPGAKADCFSYDCSTSDRNGHQRLCECIIYTNTLTEVERTAVARYLMEKWMNSEVNWTQSAETNSLGDVTLGADSPGFAVAGGETGYAESVSGAGTFRKTGAGTMTVGEFADSDAALHVHGGTLEIASQRLTADTLPSGAYLHVDASALDTLTTNVTADGVTRVTKWESVDEGGKALSAVSTSTNKAVFVADACNGKPAIDFGPRRYMSGSGYDKYQPDLRLPAGVLGIRTVFAVIDSSQGGGSLIPSCGGGYNGDSGGPAYGLLRGNASELHGGSKDDSIVWGSADPNNYVDSGLGTGRTWCKVNGEYVDVKSDGLSGGWDVVSFANHYKFGLRGLGSDHYAYFIGGQKFAEYMAYTQMLSRATISSVEAYLKEKWFGTETAGYRATRAASVAVDSGATLRIASGGPITTGALSGGGTVDGSIVLSPDAEIDVEVGAGGVVEALSITGSLAASDGTVHLSGNVRELALGRYAIVSASSLPDQLAGWTVVSSVRPAHLISLEVENGTLYLVAKPKGITINFR
jgi:hypothetical protein